ncbi:S41 family peptidase [Tamlana crocina]|uniref:Peptidase S41 n=1 Tax=Tamlana crocina TaxID=393006 RepID=A0ABX1D716_9FLAO|nr:S41 family peptidase [Tamlana crocina]NJX14100.1 peptidase S41 [Tamlana crocina]
MKYILFILLLAFYSCSSQVDKKYNLNFETYNARYLFPKDWIEWGKYNLSADTTIARSGKYSGKIKSKNNHDAFGSLAYKIPADYKGENITLEGFMKIKNVEDGYAGLLLRIDGNTQPLGFNNMKDQNIQGTKDWQKYSITLPFLKNAKNIYVGGILVGKGEAWFDDFTVTIDGEDIQTLKTIEKPIPNATLDHEFDNGSKINFPDLNDRMISNLELLGKIWGFLKYHHPEICSGNYNWDYELFRFLPKYLNVENLAERDQLLLEWIDSYGKIKICDSCKETPQDAFLKPDHAWFNDSDLNEELKEKLNFIYKNRNQGESFYIGNEAYGRLTFLNENEYYTMPTIDGGFQLLALYRYWNMIHYFFPYKHLTDNNWSSILKKYIPDFINCKNRLDYELACIRLITEINDTHATTSVGFTNVHHNRGSLYPPFIVKFIENQLVVTNFYDKNAQETSKIKVGDIITHINNKPIKTIIDSIGSYYPASNETSKLRNISRDLLRSSKKKIAINYISNNQKKHLEIELSPEDDWKSRWHDWKDEKCYKFIKKDIGYITLKTITKSDVPIIKEQFKSVKGIIIDIRNYPATFVPFILGSYFVSNDKHFAKFTSGKVNNPGEFSFREGDIILKAKETYKGKLVVLVNEDSQSQSEYTAMAFRAGNNTTIIGSTTAGADGNVISLSLPGGLLTGFSGLGVYYPNGTETQRVGIIPDIEIKPTIKGIKERRDEVLERAIKFINNN